MAPFDERTTTQSPPNSTPERPTDGSSSPPLFRDQAADLKAKAARGARAFAEGAQNQARSRLDRGKDTAAATLTSVATTLMHSGNQLRDEQEDMAGEYIERFARGVDRAAQYMQRADVREITNDIENFARKRPALFVGTAFAAGLIAGRIMKSTRRPTNGNADGEPLESSKAESATAPWQSGPEPGSGMSANAPSPPVTSEPDTSWRGTP